MGDPGEGATGEDEDTIGVCCILQDYSLLKTDTGPSLVAAIRGLIIIFNFTVTS